MNFLLFNEDEISADKKQATIFSKRLKELKKRFVFKVGKKINVGVVGGKRGEGILTQCSDDCMVFDISLSMMPLSKNDIELIVSVCRPQTNKKILHIATSLGVKEVSFIRGENIPKSYLQSTSLSEENIKQECLLAMEQTGDTIFPDIKIYSSIYSYFHTKDFSNKTCLVADTICEEKIKTSDFLKINCIAIGPESGWSENELKFFHSKSFKSIGLGDRILRVEVATTYFLGKIL